MKYLDGLTRPLENWAKRHNSRKDGKIKTPVFVFEESNEKKNNNKS
jgi:hypothetical protein